MEKLKIRYREESYLTRERSRFSASMIWSVEVGIHRRTEGHKDHFFAGDVPVAAVADAAADVPAAF